MFGYRWVGTYKGGLTAPDLFSISDIPNYWFAVILGLAKSIGLSGFLTVVGSNNSTYFLLIEINPEPNPLFIVIERSASRTPVLEWE